MPLPDSPFIKTLLQFPHHIEKTTGFSFVMRRFQSKVFGPGNAADASRYKSMAALSTAAKPI
jgi:hypothetical protein